MPLRDRNSDLIATIKPLFTETVTYNNCREVYNDVGVNRVATCYYESLFRRGGRNLVDHFHLSSRDALLYGRKARRCYLMRSQWDFRF